jgi:hypothetical protein
MAKPSFDLAVAGDASAAMIVVPIRYFLTVTVLSYAASRGPGDVPYAAAAVISMLAE